VKHRAHRLFNLYRGEGRQALFFASLAFVLFFAVSLGSKLSDTLFLTHLSANKLPFAYGTSATLLIASLSFILYAYHHFSPAAIFSKVLMGALLFYTLVVGGVAFSIVAISPWSWFFLKVATQILYIQILSCFWTYLDEYYHFQDAKRLFTLFNASIAFGLTCTGMVIRSNFFSIAETFSLVVTLLFFAVMLLKYCPFTTLPDEREGEVMEEISTTKSFFQAVTQSRFSLLLMCGNLLIYLLMNMTEFGYLSAFQSSFESLSNTQDASQALAHFYGTCLAAVGLCNLITGWFCYSRAVLRFGVNSLILLTPLAFAITFTGWQFDTTLLFPLIGLFVVESMMPIIEDNNFNLMLNAVPMKIKAKVRVVIESFSEPCGMILSAILLTCTQIESQFLDWKILGLLFAILSLTVAFSIRKRYHRAILENLKNHALQLYKNSSECLSELSKKENKAVEQKLLLHIHSHDTVSQKLCLETFIALNKPLLLQRAFAEEPTLSDLSKIHFLELLDESPLQKERFIIETAYLWQQETTNKALSSHIDFYLAKQGLFTQEKAEALLQSNILLERAAAIIHLNRTYAHPSLDAIQSRDQAKLAIEKLLQSTNDEELTLGLYLIGFDQSSTTIERLLRFVEHPSLKVAKSALKSLERCFSHQDVAKAPLLLDAIARRHDSEFRLLAMKALIAIDEPSLIQPIVTASATLRMPDIRKLEMLLVTSFGTRSTDELVLLLKSPAESDRARLTAGKTLAQLKVKELEKHLPEVLSEEIARARFYFYSAHTLPENYQGHDLTLLKQGLLSNFQSVIDFTIHLLGASYWIEDAPLLVSSLRSKNVKIQSSAIESLEIACERSIFKLLYPLIGDMPLSEKMRHCKKFLGDILEVPQLLQELQTRGNVTQSPLDLLIASMWKERLAL